MSKNMRTTINYNPYEDDYKSLDQAPWEPLNQWPCRWISINTVPESPFLAAYKCEFTIDKDCTVRMHVSADERYHLFLDGKQIGSGSERGDQNNWFYETYDIPFTKGNHVIVALVWSMGDMAPWAQISVKHGFILSPEGKEYVSLFGTGTAQWLAKGVCGVTFTGSRGTGAGSRIKIDANQFPWGIENGEGDNWENTIAYDYGNNGFYLDIMRHSHIMTPAMLPQMLEKECKSGVVRYIDSPSSSNTEEIPVDMNKNISVEVDLWQGLISGSATTVPSHTSRRVLIDLENYFCIYPHITVSGGKDAVLRISFCESLYEQNPGGNFGSDVITKGNRSETDGKYFYGLGDEFLPDGEKKRTFSTLWWNAGRYIEIYIETKNEELVIDDLTLTETRYPLQCESSFSSSSPVLESIIPMCFRSLQECSHETYMDCPFYEQLMYVGDTRLQALVTYVSAKDSTLPKKAVRMFETSRMNHSQMVNCSYPADSGKIIPSFCLWWVAMVYDYALWRGDKEFISSMMAGVRDTVDMFLSDRDGNGLIKTPHGWNYLDANEKWQYGVPTDNGLGVTAFLNVQMSLILEMVSHLELFVGEDLMSKRALLKKAELDKAIIKMFWDDDNKLFADDIKKTSFSQHVQSLALLNKGLSEGKEQMLLDSLLHRDDIVKTNVFFTHYVFEAFSHLGHADYIMDKLTPWLDLLDNGFATTPEHFSPSTRSDCHAWGAHPIYHYFTGILGIRPESMGFETVKIEPSLGTLSEAHGKMVHPLGMIEAEYTKSENVLNAVITLPDGLNGTFIYNGKEFPLSSGEHNISVEI